MVGSVIQAFMIQDFMISKLDYWNMLYLEMLLQRSQNLQLRQNVATPFLKMTYWKPKHLVLCAADLFISGYWIFLVLITVFLSPQLPRTRLSEKLLPPACCIMGVMISWVPGVTLIALNSNAISVKESLCLWNTLCPEV